MTYNVFGGTLTLLYLSIDLVVQLVLSACVVTMLLLLELINVMNECKYMNTEVQTSLQRQ